MNPMAVIGIAQGIFSLIGASKQRKAAQQAAQFQIQGAQMSQAAYYANAQDALAVGAANAGAIMKAARNNAAMEKEIGYSNAKEILKQTTHNLKMYQIQSDEEQKIHKREQEWHGGEIRARFGSTGISVNSGTPLAFLRSEMTKAKQERQYMLRRDLYTMLGEGEKGLRQSLLTVKTANWSAHVMVANAKAQAGAVMAGARAQSNAMRRQGDIAYQMGMAQAAQSRAAGKQAMIGGIGNALGSFAGAFGNMGGFGGGSSAIGMSSPTFMQAGRSFAPNYFTTGQVGF